MMTSGEISQALEEGGIEPEPGPTSHPRTDEAVYQRRWEGLAEAISDLEVEEREAEVLWGRDFRRVFRPLHGCVSDLWVAIFRHLRAQAQSSGPLDSPRLDPEDRKEIDDVIYQVSRDPDEDEFTRRVVQALEEVEDRVRPHLQIRRSLFGRLREALGLS